MKKKLPNGSTELLATGKNFYKANLHTHSTVSDGTWTVEEIKEAYMAKGYSIVAYTDHEVCVDQSHLTDDNFLAITGYEIGINEDSDPKYRWNARAYHLNLLAKDPQNTKQIYYNPCYLFGNTLAFEEKLKGEKYYIRDYSVDTVNDIIRTANENGFLVCYNHPHWSLQTSEDYKDLKGLWALEVVNGGSMYAGYEENQPHVYDEMLRAGKRILPVTGDDSHHIKHAFGTFTMISADELKYPTIMEALEKGDFYCSEKPEMYSINLHNGKLHVKCSPARQIRVITERRYMFFENAKEGETITEATFYMSDWFSRFRPDTRDDVYFRVSVTDREGYTAYSRAYYYDEIVDQF